jgi:hypothetical protein
MSSAGRHRCARPALAGERRAKERLRHGGVQLCVLLVAVDVRVPLLDDRPHRPACGVFVGLRRRGRHAGIPTSNGQPNGRRRQVFQRGETVLPSGTVHMCIHYLPWSLHIN